MSEPKTYDEGDLEFFEATGDTKNAAIAREHIVRRKEVNALLEKNGVTREDVENKAPDPGAPPAASQSTKTNPNEAASLMDLISSNQLTRIKKLNGPGCDVEAKCVEMMGCTVEQLSQKAADQFIRKIILLPRAVDALIDKAGEMAAGDKLPAPKSLASVVNASASIPFTAKGSTSDDPGPNWADKLGDEYKRSHAHAQSIDQEAFPDYPTQLVTSIVKGDGIITKEDVLSVLAEFSLTVSLDEVADEAKAIVVTDSSQTALMKTARELRLRLRKERIRIEHARQDVKEPYLRRVQVIDGVGKYLKDQFLELEEHLQTQEDFEKIETQKRQDALDVVRITDLQDNFDWKMPVEMIGQNILGKMNDGEWSAYRTGVEGKYLVAKAEADAAEAARVLREEAAQIEIARTKQLVARGLKFDGRHFTLGEISIDLENIRAAAAESFDRLIVDVTPKVAEILEAEHQANAMFERKQTRIDRLARIGVKWNGTHQYEYTGHLLDVLITTHEIESISDEEFEMKIANFTATIEQDRTAKAEEDARLLEVAEKEALEAVEAERLRLAPDKDKLLAYAAKLESMVPPQVDQALTPLIGEIEASLGAVVDMIRTRVESQ